MGAAAEVGIEHDLTVKRRKVAHEVRDAILGMLRDGALEDGDRLPPERELAARFGVSRTTLRDALRELELLGYVEARQGDGTHVRLPGAAALAAPFGTVLRARPQVARDLLEFRRIVEPEIAALAAERAGDDDVARLRASLERQRRRVERGAPLVDEDLAFHRALADAAGNATVQHVLDTLHTLLREMRTQLLPGDRPELAVEQHRAVVDAVARHDAAAARRAALDHLAAVGRGIRRDDGGTR